MPTVMLMEWPGVEPAQYDEVMRVLRLDEQPPENAYFHVSGFEDGTLRVLDIWESQADFERFQESRLMSAVQQAGIEGQPNVRYYDVHNIYVPEAATLERIGGGTSLPA
jgi:hypothetical protein